MVDRYEWGGAGAPMSGSSKSRSGVSSRAASASKRQSADSPYQLRISRLTVDKLGVKLYDKASAVVAELIANGYDADAEVVTVKIPLGTALAMKTKRGGIRR